MILLSMICSSLNNACWDIAFEIPLVDLIGQIDIQELFVTTSRSEHAALNARFDFVQCSFLSCHDRVLHQTWQENVVFRGLFRCFLLTILLLWHGVDIFHEKII